VQIIDRTLVGAGAVVRVRDDDGAERVVPFPDNPAPTDEEIIAAVEAQRPTTLVPGGDALPRWVYVDPAGEIVGVGTAETGAPEGTEAVQIARFPTGLEDWNPETRTFAVDPGIRALLLRTTIPTLLWRLETIDKLTATLPASGTPGALPRVVMMDLEARRNRVVGYLTQAMQTYTAAGNYFGGARKRATRARGRASSAGSG
jgi:hypothetical protein